MLTGIDVVAILFYYFRHICFSLSIVHFMLGVLKNKPFKVNYLCSVSK